MAVVVDESVDEKLGKLLVLRVREIGCKNNKSAV